jgi:hypothetical protein
MLQRLHCRYVNIRNGNGIIIFNIHAIEIRKVVVLGTMLVHGNLRHRTAAQLRACVVVYIIQGVGSHGCPMVSEEIRTQVCEVRG